MSATPLSWSKKGKEGKIAFHADAKKVKTKYGDNFSSFLKSYGRHEAKSKAVANRK